MVVYAGLFLYFYKIFSLNIIWIVILRKVLSMGANIINENNLLFENKKLDFAKIVSLVIFLSIFFGGIVIFTYLKDIGQTAIFPDLLQMAYSLSALTIVFVFLSVVLLFCMFVHICVIIYLKEK